MGVIVIAAYRPKPGQEDALLQLTQEHVPLLRELALATERPALAMRAKDGTIVEVFEWESQAAVERAHGMPQIHSLWARYELACDYVKLIDVPEAADMWASFEPIDLD